MPRGAWRLALLVRKCWWNGRVQGRCKGGWNAWLRECATDVPRFVRRAWKHTIVQCLRMFPELNALLRVTSALWCYLQNGSKRSVLAAYPFHVHRSSLWVQLETSMKNPQLLLLKMRMRIQAMQGGAGEYTLKTWVMPNDGVSIPAHSICLPSMGMNFTK